MTTLLIVFLLAFPIDHKLHGKNVKLNKLAAHNIQINTLELIKGTTIIFITEEYD